MQLIFNVFFCLIPLQLIFQRFKQMYSLFSSITAWVVADLLHKTDAKLVKGDHRCNNCGRTYTQNYNLRRHLIYECGQEPRFKCGNCSKKFKRKAVLQEHLIFIHGFSKEDAKNISNNS